MTQMTAGVERRSAAERLRPAADRDLRPLRVCHVSMHLQTGGLERLLVEFARLHDRELVQPVFVALQDVGQPADDIAGFGYAVHRLNLKSHGKWKTLLTLKRLLVTERIDLVHTHNTYAHFYAAIAARLAGIRCVVNTQHGRGCGPGWKARLQFRIANRFTARVIGVSRDAAELCREQDPRSRGRIDAIWNGIDVGRFAYSGSRLEPTLIAVGRLSPEKDFATLLRAVAIASAHVPELRLQLVGDGGERAALESLARELAIDDRVQFLGERSDVPHWLAQAGCYVSSSRTEGISLTLLEAMAVGLPVLATRVGGNPEVVQEDETGRLVTAGDPAALANAIVAMWADRELWPGMGQLGRERVERNFNVVRMVQEYERLYSEIAQDAEGHGGAA